LFRFARGDVVVDRPEDRDVSAEAPSRPERRVRADAQRSLDALLLAAKEVFATSGVDAPVREIADKAGVGLGTLYRHFPQRADLIAAVFRREIDACADIAPVLAESYAPFDALANWMQRYAEFVGTKRGLAQALHSGDPAFDNLPSYFDRRLRPALRALLGAAVTAGEVRADVDADELLGAVASLCMSAHNAGPGRAERMVALLVDGLRYGASPSAKTRK
jgi:AcrR family transcriptional regulator